MTDNVIAFPRGKRGSPPQSIEETMASIEAIRTEHIEFLVDECCSFIFGRLLDEGFDLGDEAVTKHSALLVEAMKSALCASVGIKHPLQTLSDKMFLYESEMEKAVDLFSKEQDVQSQENID
jgi:hypothetical protein